jgi:hypothetical protein
MQVRVGPAFVVALYRDTGGHVIIDDDVDALDVDTPAHKIGGHQDAVLPLLEGLVDVYPASFAAPQAAPFNKKGLQV